MVLNYEKSKPVIFVTALIFSCLFVIHFFTSFAANQVQAIIFGGLGVFVDVVAQFLLSLGRLMWKQRKYIRSVFLFIPCAAYIFVFAIPAAIGYCTTTFNIAEQAENKQHAFVDFNERRLKQVTNRIDILNDHLKSESPTSYGSRSKAVMAEIEKLSIEQEKLQNVVYGTSEKVDSTSEVSKSSEKVLKSLSLVYKKSESFLILLFFTVATSIIYLALILTSPDIGLENGAGQQTKSKLEKELAVSQEQISDIAAKKNDLIAYIQAVIRDTGTLNGNERVAAQTGLPLEQCDKFKSWLVEQGMVKVVQGASVAVLPKREILERVAEGI